MLSVVTIALAASLALGVAAAPGGGHCPTSCPDPFGSEHYLNVCKFDLSLYALISRTILQFDDTRCPSLCPVPLSYDRFAFNGASGWLFLNSSDAAHAPTPLVATTGTGTLATNSSGWVDFGSTGPGATDSFQFDLLSFYFSAWVNDGVEGHPLEFQMRGTKANGTIVNYRTTSQTGFAVGPVSLALFIASAELTSTYRT